MIKNHIIENISKNVRSKYSHKLLDHTIQFATDALKAVAKRAIQKTAEATQMVIWLITKLPIKLKKKKKITAG